MGEGCVYKLPLSERGQLANQAEYDNYLSRPDMLTVSLKLLLQKQVDEKGE